MANVGLPAEEHEEDEVETEDGTTAANTAANATTTEGAMPDAVASHPTTTSHTVDDDSDGASTGGSSVEEEAAAAQDVTTSNEAESAEVKPANETLPSYVSGESAYVRKFHSTVCGSSLRSRFAYSLLRRRSLLASLQLEGSPRLPSDGCDSWTSIMYIPTCDR